MSEVTAAEFEEAWRKGLPSMRRLAAQMVGESDMDDLLQYAMLKAWQYRANWRRECALSSWLYRAVYLKGCNWIKDRRRIPTAGASDVADFAEELPSATGSALEEALGAESGQIIAHTLARMNPYFRRAFELVQLEGLEYVQAAERMGSPLGTLRSRLHHARRILHRSCGTPL